MTEDNLITLAALKLKKLTKYIPPKSGNLNWFAYVEQNKKVDPFLLNMGYEVRQRRLSVKEATKVLAIIKEKHV